MAFLDIPPSGPFRSGVSASRDLTETGAICISIPKAIIPYLLGALEELNYPDVWIGDTNQVKRAVAQFNTFCAELGAVAALPATSELPSTDFTLVGPCSGPDCPECPDCPQTPCYGGAGADCDESEDLMPGIRGLHWEDDVLYIDWDYCCKEPVGRRDPITGDIVTGPGGVGGGGVGDIMDQGDEIIDMIDAGYEPGPNDVSLTCRKAWALGTAWDDLAKGFEEAIAQYWVGSIGTLKDAVPELDLSTVQAFNALAGPINTNIASGIVGAILWFNAYWGSKLKDKLICKLAEVLEPDTLAMTEGEWPLFWDAIESLIDDSYSKLTLKNLWLVVKKSQWRNVIAERAMSPDASCVCPESDDWMGVLPDEYDWAYRLDWTQGAYGFVATSGMGTHVPGYGWQKTKIGAPEQMSVVVNSKTRQSSGEGQVVYVQHNVSWGTSNSNGYHARYSMLTINGAVLWDEQTFPKVTFSRTFDPNVAVDPGDDVAFSFGAFSGDCPAGTVFTLKSTIIAGNGTDPFEGIAKDVAPLAPTTPMGDH